MASGPGRKPLTLGFALLALVAVVALASRGHAPTGGGGSTRHVDGDLVFEYAVLVFGVLALSMLPVLVYAFWGSRRDPGALPVRKNWMLSVFGTMSLVALALALLMGYRVLQRSDGKGKEKAAQTAPAKAAKKKQRSTAGRPVDFDWAPVVVVLSVALAGAGIASTFLLRSRRRREPSRAAAVAALSLALDESLDDLRRERDPRRAVVAAYARMERALAFAGLPRRAAEAPLEYLARVLRDLLDASAASVTRLTVLFERAKFSKHEIGPEMKEEAIDALAAVREELRAVS